VLLLKSVCCDGVLMRGLGYVCAGKQGCAVVLTLGLHSRVYAQPQHPVVQVRLAFLSTRKLFFVNEVLLCNLTGR
jgi:hypothetical protein